MRGYRLACNVFGVKPLKTIIYALFDGLGRLKTFFAPSPCSRHTHTHIGIFTTRPKSEYIEPSSARSHRREAYIIYTCIV